MTTTLSSFKELDLGAPLLAALDDVGYETPSPIQAACIPPLLAGADIIGEAQTGTGKTAAFALPCLARIDLSDNRPQVLVLAPTRELAIQVSEAFQRYARNMPGFNVMPVYGGQSMVVQLRQLKRGAHVVVGTPGRIMDHIERKSLVLDNLKTLVLDEADEMLRMGFIDDVEWILGHTPAERQTALFSATMPEPIRRIAHRYLRDPQEVKIKAATTTVSTITQKFCQVSVPHKLDALTRILEIEDMDAGIIFVRTKVATEELATRLEARGHAVGALNGDMTQQLRERVVEQLKRGALDLVVATDVAARGLDVSRITHVINYDIPYDTEAYVHRIGRTGRAGRLGTAILFVTPREQRMLKSIERATRQKIEPLPLPSREAIADRRISLFREQVEAVLQSDDLDFFREVVASLEADGTHELHDIAAALAHMATRDRPLQLPNEGGRDFANAAPSPRTDREPRENREKILERRRDYADGKLSRYRIAVGKHQLVTPKDIVGALANEGGIESRFIGQINLYEDYSTVELPADLPNDVMGALARLRVRQHVLHLRPVTPDENAHDERRARTPRSTPSSERKPRKSFDKPARSKPARADSGDRPPRARKKF
ncbi:DEAD/DEAH box helicase [Pseudazoarcus pumilus]|uniref:ATP-dependent RNA helicase DeaD n=1 Tax=Pseudazoarcus pumilus TaxID=2067960 RepID=A0A2I6S7Q1_9RHOO|nr:DEAD/DEAH box helicase [Pseudazoarcus pumilus]AUN95285.1 ATP-dependent RNA helicase [Pseudazoarcus pumilus]